MSDSAKGAVFFQSVAAYYQNIERQESIVLPNLREWHQVIECVRRGTLFSLTIKSPALHASLRFDPAHSVTGGYDLTFNMPHRTERGTIRRVTEFDDGDLHLVSAQVMLPFRRRFRVSTIGSNPRERTKIWFIGINHCEEFPPDSTDQET
jgi:hypothetical protein